MSNEKDVVYAGDHGLERKLDIYRPRGEAKHAAILFFHGGGWRGGAKEGMRPDAAAMAEAGYVGIPVQYRLSGEAPYPAHIHDVKSAIRWVRAHAEDLGIDPEKIILWGSSAGAHLSLLAAGTADNPDFEGDGPHAGVSTSVAAVIAVHPPVEFHTGEAVSRHTTPCTNLLGDKATAEQARAASPMTYVTEASPPVLLLHGTRDQLVNHAASQAYFEAMRAAKAPSDIHLFNGHNHGFAALPSMRALIAPIAANFLDRHVIDPGKHQAELEQFSMFSRQRAAASQGA